MKHAALVLALVSFIPTLALAGPFDMKVRRYELADRIAPPPMNAVVFAGSSSIENWAPTLAEDFPGVKTIGRGLSGSTYAALYPFHQRIIAKYRPRVIVLYSGDNDLASGRAPELVVSDAIKLVDKLHALLPRTRIIVGAIKLSIARRKFRVQIEATNQLLDEALAKRPYTRFADTHTPLLGHDGEPVPALFRKDGLHLTHEGYVRWAQVIAPLLRD